MGKQLAEEMLKKERPNNWDKIFEKELYTIQDEKVRDFTLVCLEKAPGYFWHCASSLSGKYHSSFGQGEGGLIRHTRALCYFARELTISCDPFDISNKYDLIISAGILHDLFKYGINFNYNEYLHHGEIAAKYVWSWGKSYGLDEEKLREICNGILFHLGKYEKRSNTLEWQDKLVKKTHYVIQVCDIISSRKEVDIIGLFENYSSNLNSVV